MSDYAVSLIVATVERTRELDALFQSLAEQTFTSFEVIVVDQNIDDRLVPYVERARQAGLQVKHLKHYPPNLSVARNVGIAQARGDWIGFPDDDCWYEPGLLEQLKLRFACTDPLSGAAVQWVEEGVPPGAGTQLSWERSSKFRDIPVASFQLFFHRGLFEKIGDFDPLLGVGLWFGAGEETDLVLRALRAGALVTYSQAARVHHPLKPPPPTPQARQAARLRARGAGALYVKHQLPGWVVARGLVAPVLRPLLKGRFGPEISLGCAIVRGRLDGWLGWRKRSQ